MLTLHMIIRRAAKLAVPARHVGARCKVVILHGGIMHSYWGLVQIQATGTVAVLAQQYVIVLGPTIQKQMLGVISKKNHRGCGGFFIRFYFYNLHHEVFAQIYLFHHFIADDFIGGALL